jgi:hypothetical protein
MCLWIHDRKFVVVRGQNRWGLHAWRMTGTGTKIAKVKLRRMKNLDFLKFV